MRIDLISFSIILCLLLCACVPKQELDAAKALAQDIGAQSYHVKNNLSGFSPSIELSFEGVTNRDTGDRLASLCAYTFFKKNPPADIKYERILINMRTQSSNVRKSYNNTDILLTDTLLQGSVQTLFKYYHDSTNYVLSQEYLKNTPFYAVAQEMAFMDSVYGHFSRAKIAGFKPDSILVGGTKVPILKMWVRVYYKRKSFPYYLGFYTDDRKLAFSICEFDPRDASRQFDFTE